MAAMVIQAHRFPEAVAVVLVQLEQMETHHPTKRVMVAQEPHLLFLARL